ncbi:YchJ family metal-binding protein [uncultured Corynebacterium sp.]|uniref:YchJ family protein n=1 Tax=uncultured Corynebacterium sp. TaxID=159447 RepID=UPI00260056A5|nr:YchJ family metal-binding protein [uncultured Corynebacterium sp.]
MIVLNPLPDDARCPCGTGLPFGQCCGKYHAGAKAPTAETLMRSRFSAFVTGDEEYLLRTWDPDTRPLDLRLRETSIRFYRLDILDVVGGGPLDDAGVVEFEAFYKGSAVGSQRERSSFRRVDGAWVYSTGDVS